MLPLLLPKLTLALKAFFIPRRKHCKVGASLATEAVTELLWRQK
jgi:hypothetical protein